MNKRKQMNKRKTAYVLAVCMGLTAFTGCGTAEQKNYEQAASDLKNGNYENALQEYATAVSDGIKPAQSYRGAGVASFYLGNYEDAIENFTNALKCDKVGKVLKKDILSYRAAAYLKTKSYDEAMADCQSLARDYDMDSDLYFLTGQVALAMDVYEEAAADFQQAYGEEATYDMAIRIYEAYLSKDMEADGTRYLEAALSTEAENAQDHCDRGRVYYYMNDYENAVKELIQASNDGNLEAVLLLGMVYMDQKDISNARALFQEYISKAEKTARGYCGLAVCDMKEGDYDSALANISSGMATADQDDLQSLLFNEIVVYERKLDFATALEKAQEYLEMYPDDKTAKKEMVFLKTRVNTN